MPLAPRTFLLISLALAAPAVARAQEATPTPNEQAAERVYTFEEVTKPAVIISMPPAQVQAKKGKLLDRNGTVKVGVVLSSNGQVRDVMVLEGLSQSQNFAAVKAARRITFMPAQKDGRPVSQMLVAEYTFRLVTEEYGTAAELKGLSKFYVDAGGDAEARVEITDEILKRLPQLASVESPEQAEFIVRFDSYERREGGSVGSSPIPWPHKVSVGRGWVVRPLAEDRRRQLMYFDNTKSSPGEGKPSRQFARAFVYEYKAANGLKN
jgi:TonB family protein